jgi:PAS domain S-box-containing protein
MELELTHLIDALPGLVWTALPNGGAEFINRRWCEYTGLSPDQAAGFGWQSAIHPRDRTLVLERWRSFLQSGQGGAVEARLRRYDGEYRRFLLSTAPLADKSGQVVKWCGINTDIEEQLKAEETLRARDTHFEREQADAALKTSEAELRLAYAHLTVAQRLSAMGSFTSDLLADEHTWSDEFYRICEFESGSKVTTQKLRDIVHLEDRPLFDAVLEHAIAGNDVDYGFRIVTCGGVIKHLHAVGRLSEHVHGRPIFMGAVQDVTASKLAEEALKAREAELRQALDHLSEAQRLSKTGSFTSDLARDEHFWSDGFYRICEFELGSKITTQKLQGIVHPEDLISFQGAIGRAIAGEDPEFVFRIVTPLGVMALT